LFRFAESLAALAILMSAPNVWNYVLRVPHSGTTISVEFGIVALEFFF